MRILLHAILLAAVALTANAADRDGIVIAKRRAVYEVTVPVSELVMTIPAKDLSSQAGESVGVTASKRYFHFLHAGDGIIVSGWFEDQAGYPGLAALWKLQAKDWANKQLPEPLNVAFKKVSGWEVIEYDVLLDKIHNTHIRAQWLEAGTWIDVHLSVSSEATLDVNLALLESFLTTIRITKR